MSQIMGEELFARCMVDWPNRATECFYNISHDHFPFSFFQISFFTCFILLLLLHICFFFYFSITLRLLF